MNVINSYVFDLVFDNMALNVNLYLLHISIINDLSKCEFNYEL